MNDHKTHELGGDCRASEYVLSISGREGMPGWQWMVLLLLFWTVPLVAEENAPPSPVSAMYPTPDAYTFAMRLPPGTDCIVSAKLQGGGETKSRGKQYSPSPGKTPEGSVDMLKIRRSFREGIASSTESVRGRNEETFYFIGKACVYDSPNRGIRILPYLVNHDASNIATYHFPELIWAVPSTRQPNPESPKGAPAVHLYQNVRENQTLIVDAISGYPLRYIDGGMEWIYSYKTSTAPIVMPEKLQKAVERLSNPSR